MLTFELKRVQRKIIPVGPYDKIKDLGVLVCWHADVNDEDGENVPFVRGEDNELLYSTYPDTDIKVSVCVPTDGNRMKITAVFMRTGVMETKELEPGRHYTFPTFQVAGDKPRYGIVIRDERDNELVKLVVQPEKFSV